MVLGIGVDLCEVERMARAMARGGFLERFFTEGERAYIESRGKVAPQSAAGCFAAKEAALKALGCGIAMPLAEVEIEHDALGAPRYALSGEARARMEALGGKNLHLSITHTETTAAAVAVLEG